MSFSCRRFFAILNTEHCFFSGGAPTSPEGRRTGCAIVPSAATASLAACMINYPVVKSADNNEYLTKTFTANDNKLGAIFVDMRNSNDFSDKNTFIYGHHLNVGGEMFSELLKYENESFCKKHPNFYIYTPDGKVRTYKVFSAGVVKDTADNYKLDYATDADYEAYLKLCEESSNYKVEDVELTAQSQIVSLSTCTNVRDDERFLVQGVLTAVD